ncbi:unnamed protein product [Allacma fusca]|uniref:Transforming acidic coiled-coil-containing protein C-terminal domain-containing protein n=1 Tax=Allacma fusca TaxID=39272 RepID=A0A8J2LD31_9HEXA|nr:unnamed protein product [Allacma fusca]
MVGCPHLGVDPLRGEPDLKIEDLLIIVNIVIRDGSVKAYIKDFVSVVTVAPPGVESDFPSLIAPSQISGNCGNIMPPSITQSSEMNGLTDNMENDILNQRQEYYSRVLAEKDSEIKALEEIKSKMELQLAQEQSASRVLREYEKTMALYAQQIDEMKQKLDRADAIKQVLINERDQALEDLRNVENAFSDVHRKYERIKIIVENFRKNEDILKQRDYEMQIKLENRDKKIEALKQKCQEALETMHRDYENRLRDSETETHKLRALLRKTEMKIDSLENDLEQKGKENSQLSVLCDELISAAERG